jgi:uncharacterized membrane protein YgaE (UPF0421/DUF939 family)
MKPVTSRQLMNSLQVGFAGFLATGLYTLFGNSAGSLNGFYVVYGVARSLLPTPEASLASAKSRVVGTVFGGVVVALLILVLNNWVAIGIGYVVIQLLGRKIGLSPSALLNASIMTVLLLAVPSYNQSGGWFVFFRTTWHLIGLGIGMAVERVFWFRSPQLRLRESEKNLMHQIDKVILNNETQTADDLIALYADHCRLRLLVLRKNDGGQEQINDDPRREELIERALRHAVAMQRVPSALREIDERVCKAAITEYARLKDVGGLNIAAY